MQIFITGVCGFIGTNLLIRLRKRYPHAYIRGVDNNVTSKDLPLHYELLNALAIEPIEDYTFHSNRKYDWVFHLASPASPVAYQRDPIGTIKANIWGLMKVLPILRTSGKIFFASSSEVYGDPAIPIQHEAYTGNVNFTGVRACYDESKRMCETILYDTYRQKKTEFIAGRFFNVYGPYMQKNDGRVVTNFINAGIKLKPLEIYGDGYQTRCLTYIDDALDAVIDLMESKSLGSFNIGSTDERSVLDIARAIRHGIAEYRNIPDLTRVVHVAPLPDDPRQRMPDLNRITNAINWKAKVPMVAGIRRTIEYFWENQ